MAPRNHTLPEPRALLRSAGGPSERRREMSRRPSSAGARDAGPRVGAPAFPLWAAQVLTVSLLSASALVGAAGCRQVGKLAHDEEISRFRDEGMEAGAGLRMPELELPAAPVEREPEQAPLRPGPIAAAARGAEPLVRARLQCRGLPECLEDNRRALMSMGTGAGEELLAIALGDHPLDLRVEAVRAAGWMRLESACAGLRRLVADRDPVVAQEAMWALGQIGDRDAVDTLATQLTSRHAPLRQAAVRALGHVGTTEAVGALVAAWPRAKPGERAALVAALGRSGHPDAESTLQRAARDPDPVVQAEARMALSRLEASNQP